VNISRGIIFRGLKGQNFQAEDGRFWKFSWFYRRMLL